MQSTKRLKWEPAALMVLVLGLGLWIAFGPASKPKFQTEPNPITMDDRLGNTRGELEAFKREGESDYSFRYWIVRGPAKGKELSRADAEAIWGKENIEEL